MSEDVAPFTVEDTAEHDRTINFDRFAHADAWALGQQIVRIARERSLAITAAIWLGEQRVFHFAASGTSADNDLWMDRKAALVRRYDASSWHTTLLWRSHGVTEALPRFGLDPAVHSLAGGGFPIRIHGTSVGVVVVSGLDDNSDHAVVVEALRALLPVHDVRLK